MKIISFRAENVKRLHAVSITPDGSVVEITGRNGAGKTSVLDSIWMALRGRDAIPDLPIRKGAETAFIELDLGRYKVTRKFKDKEGKTTTSLIVETDDGIKAQEPQKILDAIYGELTFDPLAFTRQKPREQFETLRQFVPGVDFDAIEKANEVDFKARTDINRRAKELRAQIAGVIVPDIAGQVAIDESALISDLAGAGEFNTNIERQRNSRNAGIDRGRTLLASAESLTQRAVDLRKQADAADVEAAAITLQVTALRNELQALPALPDPRDTADLQAKIAEARRTNAAIETAARAQQVVNELTASAVEQEANADDLTAAMKARTEAKQTAVAEAKLPVSGITFGDGAILLNGVPFDQGSDAEQLRASIELAAAMNPKLKVLRIRDGSLLDKAAFASLEQYADEKGFQIWVECVESPRKSAIVIEDGHVHGAAKQQAAE